MPQKILVTTSSAAAIFDGLCSIDELAAAFGVTPRTIKNWMATPSGLPHIRAGRKFLFDVGKVRAWLEAGEAQRNPRRSPRAA